MGERTVSPEEREPTTGTGMGLPALKLPGQRRHASLAQFLWIRSRADRCRVPLIRRPGQQTGLRSLGVLQKLHCGRRHPILLTGPMAFLISAPLGVKGQRLHRQTADKKQSRDGEGDWQSHALLSTW